jgi:hypothetical protein
MANGRIGRVLPLLVVVAAAGCYSGLGLEPKASDGDSGIGAGDGDDADTGDHDGEPEGRCGDASVGATDLRRLTAVQFDNTVRDLLGLEGAYSAGFTADERVGPFTSNVAAPVSELQVELYMAASEAIAADAIVDLGALLPCDPTAAGEDTCAEQFLADLTPRAYRRPLAPGELDRVLAVYETGKSEGGFANGLRLAIAGILQSPYFLYHVEFGADGQAADGATVALDDYEMASRLSYFLWNTMPDDELFAAAAAGELTRSDRLASIVDQMIVDARTAEAIDNFHTQWLGVDEMERVEKDADLFPTYSTQLAAAMKDEVSAFARHVLLEGDGRLETLLTGSFTVSDDPALLALYGAERPVGHEPGTPIALDPAERAGLLTMPAVLAKQSHPNQTSPIHRGVLVRQDFFCQPLPPPPPDVDDVAPDPDPNSTTRDRFSEHTSNPDCSGCHQLIDPIGFGLENYDAIGAFRTQEGDLPVDASGELIATDIDQTFEGGVELAHLMADSTQVRQCLSKQWFRFATGRGETSEDRCSLDHLYETMDESDGDVRALLRAIVMSDGFRFRRAAAPGEDA